MQFISRYFNLLISVLICLLSVIALIVNYFGFQFSGNDYFPPGSCVIAAILIITWLGTYLLFDINHACFKIMREMVYFFLLFALIAFATNAVQLTPFEPIDIFLIKLDRSFGIESEAIIAWLSNKNWLKSVLGLSYDSLPMQMAYLPLILIVARKFNYLREFYSLLLITTLFGFVFYYFWPTLGPASAIGSPYFTTYQYATGIKFTEIHNHIQPTTAEGGMIAMPSFHTIWALLCLRLSRCFSIIFFLLLPLNLLLILSCVLLGWHYFIDLIGSMVVLVAAYGVYRFFVAPLTLIKPKPTSGLISLQEEIYRIS
ncbi:MAG: phosphatase PAP2 family protein [Tatlockia sp.]|nr:phosphatase PAP2 family protein [Tatlockia sp.]